MYALPGAQALPGRFDPLQKAWVSLQTVVEPVVLRLEAKQDSRGLSMAGDDHLLLLGQPQVLREVILHFGERYLLHSSLRLVGAKLRHLPSVRRPVLLPWPPTHRRLPEYRLLEGGTEVGTSRAGA